MSESPHPQEIGGGQHAEVEPSTAMPPRPADETPVGGAEDSRRGRLVGRIDQLRGARILFGIVSLMVAVGYLVMALGMPQGSRAQPGPGMWPVAVGAAWLVISLIVILEAALSSQVEGALDLPIGVYRRDAIIFFAATVAYVILMPLLGQYISSSLYCITLVKSLSRLPWWRVLVYALVMALGVSWVFLNLLQIRLPEGLIFDLIGL